MKEITRFGLENPNYIVPKVDMRVMVNPEDSHHTFLEKSQDIKGLGIIVEITDRDITVLWDSTEKKVGGYLYGGIHQLLYYNPVEEYFELLNKLEEDGKV